jgi:GNAT superfamily N-acetyltransferase
MSGTTKASEAVVVRGLAPEDLEPVIALDARLVGRRRAEYFRVKLRQNLAETGIKISLAADIDGHLTGFLLARVYYGEFGLLEPAAVLDTIGVDPAFHGRGVAGALVAQLRRNLIALRVPRLQTEVSWDDPSLISFFRHEGFRPAPRFCVDLDLTASPAPDPVDE